MRMILAATTLSLFMAGLSPLAQAETYTLDPSHTHIAFEIDHLGLSTTYGQFDGFTGTLSLDPEKPGATSVSVDIETKTVDTNWEARDEHLRKADFFDVEKFPKMTFKSTGVAVTGDTTATMTGDLTILGVTKPVTLDVTLNHFGAHPLNPDKQVAGFSARGVIKRSDFGMKTYLPVLGDEVVLKIETEASPAE